MRVKPNFDKKDQTKKDNSLGCFQSVLLMVIGYFVLSGIDLVFANLGSRLGQIICIGTVICIILLFVWDSRKKDQENKRLQEERQRWKSTCRSAEVAVVSRFGFAGTHYIDDNGDYHSSHAAYYLDLEMSADQKAIASGQPVVHVNMDSITYDKLAKRDTVRIYYKPEAPLTFLLEEEI